jgi:glutamate mutase epsilon subunit
MDTRCVYSAGDALGLYAFQTYEYDVMFKPGYSTRGRMIPAFDAGDGFRDLNIANIAYARLH